MTTAAEPGKILHEVRTGPLIDGSTCRRSTTGPSTPHRCGSACSTTRGAGASATTRSLDVARPARRGHGVADVARAVPVLPRRERPRAEQPGLEGLRRLDPGCRRRHRRAARSRCARCRATRSVRRSTPAACSTPSTGRAAMPRGGSPTRLAASLPPSSSGSTDRPARSPPSPSTARGGAVDSLTSNIGHLPATGILDDDEVAAVAAHLGRRRLDSGYGLRTLADDHPRYNPLGYHTGTVWPHDTAIAIDGLARTGHGDVAGRLALGLLHASAPLRPPPARAVRRLAGERRPRRLPIRRRAGPRHGRPAASLVVLRAALGLHADVPAGTLTSPPRRRLRRPVPARRDRAARRRARPRHPRRRRPAAPPWTRPHR